MYTGILFAPILQSVVGVDMSRVVVWVCWFMVALAVIVVMMLWKRSAKMMHAVSKHLLLISSGVWILGVVIYIVGYFNPQLNWISVVPRAIISSFKMFVVANDLARVAGALHKDVLYMAVFSVLHFVAAFITFLFVFKMVGYKVKSSLKILWCKWFGSKGRVVHLFWGVNEPSCLMAEDIRANYSNDVIIFVDVDQDSEESTYRKATLGGIVYAACISLGFAALETLMYILPKEDYISVGIVRGLLAVPGHFLYAVIMGYYYSMARFYPYRKGRNIFLAIALPVLAHGIYDTIIFSMDVTGSPAILLILAVNYFCFKLWKIGKRRINEHLARDAENVN